MKKRLCVYVCWVVCPVRSEVWEITWHKFLMGLIQTQIPSDLTKQLVLPLLPLPRVNNHERSPFLPSSRFLHKFSSSSASSHFFQTSNQTFWQGSCPVSLSFTSTWLFTQPMRLGDNSIKQTKNHEEVFLFSLSTIASQLYPLSKLLLKLLNSLFRYPGLQNSWSLQLNHMEQTLLWIKFNLITSVSSFLPLLAWFKFILNGWVAGWLDHELRPHPSKINIMQKINSSFLLPPFVEKWFSNSLATFPSPSFSYSSN